MKKHQLKFMAKYGDAEHAQHIIATQPHLHSSVALNPKLSEENFKSLLTTEQDPDVVMSAAKNPSLPESLMDKFMSDRDPTARYGLVENPNLKAHHIDSLINHRDSELRGWMAAKSKNLTDKHISTALEENDPEMDSCISDNVNLKPKHIDILIGRGWHDKMVHNPKITKEQLLRLSKIPSCEKAAKERLKTKK